MECWFQCRGRFGQKMKRVLSECRDGFGKSFALEKQNGLREGFRKLGASGFHNCVVYSGCTIYFIFVSITSKPILHIIDSNALEKAKLARGLI